MDSRLIRMHRLWPGFGLKLDNDTRSFYRKVVDNIETHTSLPRFAGWLSRFAMVVKVESGKVRYGEMG